MTDSGHYHDILKELSPQHRALRQAIPDVYRAFNDLGAAAMADGAMLALRPIVYEMLYGGQ